jgi:hypothetical protein
MSVCLFVYLSVCLSVCMSCVCSVVHVCCVLCVARQWIMKFNSSLAERSFVMDISRFIAGPVLHRAIDADNFNPSGRPPRVVAKMDIEVSRAVPRRVVLCCVVLCCVVLCCVVLCCVVLCCVVLCCVVLSVAWNDIVDELIV